MDGKVVLADAVGPRADCVGAPANVPVPEVGTEEPVIGKQRWEEIRRMRADGQAVSQIARATGLDRKTVRRCLRQCEWTAVSAHAAGRDAARGAHGVAHRARPAGELLGADPVPGAAREPRLRGRLRHGEERGAAAACRGHGGGAHATALRDRAGSAGAGRLGPGAHAFRLRASRGAHLRHDAGLLAPRLGRGLPERAPGSPARRPRARLRALRRVHRRDPLRPHAHGHPGHHRGQAAVEPDLRGLRPALGVRTAAVPTLPGADQGQGRERGEVREAQLPPRTGVPAISRTSTRSSPPGSARSPTFASTAPPTSGRSIASPARPASWRTPRASRASCRRCAASGSWPRTGSSRSTPTATRCPGA